MTRKFFIKLALDAHHEIAQGNLQNEMTLEEEEAEEAMWDQRSGWPKTPEQVVNFWGWVADYIEQPMGPVLDIDTILGAYGRKMGCKGCSWRLCRTSQQTA